jgi:uncharacterized protein
MLVEFSFGNFRSFKNLTTVSMVAANISSKNKELDEQNVFNTEPKLHLLKSKAIYGKNASGKSNIVKALATCLSIVKNSVKFENIINELVEPFKLQADMVEEPSFFQLIFQPANSTTIYRYGFEVQAGKVIAEWLFGKSGRVEVLYFTREHMAVQVRERWFKEAKKFEGLAATGDNEIFRDNSLFLSAVAAFGGALAKNIVQALTSIAVISGLDDPRIKNILQAKLQDKATRAEILQLMRAADFDIEDVESVETDEHEFVVNGDIPDELKPFFEVGKTKKGPSFITKRSVLGANGEKVGTLLPDLEEWESEGTKKIFFLSVFVLDALKYGETLVIDEFDARLHPLLTKKIVQLFNANETNKKGAQLVFVTHDTNLLKSDLLRRDQIAFVDKDKFAVSTLRTLVEYKGVRNDASYDKDYLSGKYAATPFLNRMNQVFEDN